MNEEDKKLLETLREMKKTVEDNLQQKSGYENYEVRNIKYYGKVELVRKTGEKESLDLHVVEVAEKGNTTGKLEEIYYLNKKEIDIEELMRKYESPEPIKDVIGKKTEKNNEEKPKEERDKELEIRSLKELEEENEKEEKENDEENSKKKNENSDANLQVKRKPTHIIEKIDPDKAKMDYWKTIKQAFGLPQQVETLAFAYPVSSEDKVNYADVTIYMLDDEGNIIPDLDVDDYFEFDSSTGNNPMSDNVIRFEEDENRGKVQIEENRTMIRLKAKQSNDNNTYISLEHKNSLGDYHDVNAGRKIIAGTQNVEKQLENTHVPAVWDVKNERFVDPRNGRYALNEKYEEAQRHKDHGDKGYVNSKDADGRNNTLGKCDFVPDTEITWEQLSESLGKNIGDLQKKFYESYNGNNGVEIVLKMEADKENKDKDKDEKVL